LRQESSHLFPGPRFSPRFQGSLVVWDCGTGWRRRSLGLRLEARERGKKSKQCVCVCVCERERERERERDLVALENVAGLVRTPSKSTPDDSNPSVASVTGPPPTHARYSFQQCLSGSSNASERTPSFVKKSSPSLSLSSLPIGNRHPSSPCVSGVSFVSHPLVSCPCVAAASINPHHLSACGKGCFRGDSLSRLSASSRIRLPFLPRAVCCTQSFVPCHPPSRSAVPLACASSRPAMRVPCCTRARRPRSYLPPCSPTTADLSLSCTT
jgi:hypothetical protein